MRTLTLLLGIGLAYGAEPWPLELFSGDPRAVLEIAARTTAPAGADAIILEARSQVRVDGRGRSFHVQRSVARIITDRGVTQFSQVSQLKLAWRRDEVRIRARIITPDGQPHPLDPATVSEGGIPTQLQGVFTDLKQVAAPLPAVAKGSVVELEVTINAQEVLDPTGGLHRWMPFSGAPIAYLAAEFEVPEQFTPQVAWRGMTGVQRRNIKEDGSSRILLTASDLPATPVMPLPPPEAATREIVFSTAPNWQHVAKWYHDIVEQKVGMPAPQKNDDPTTHLTEIGAVLADIQSKVRYTGVELGMAAYVPGTPAETLRRGYGDCKDKAVLLVNRLRASGINAKVAVLTPYPYAQVLPETPGIEAFNHAIVYVPGKKELWIDPSSEFTPAGRLPLTDEGRLALIIDPSTTGLVRTPESTATQNRALSRYEIALTEDDAPAITQTLEGMGNQEDAYRALANGALQVPPDQKAGLYDQIARNSAIGTISSIEWGAPKDLNRVHQIVFKGEKLAQAGGSEQLAFAHISPIGFDVASVLSQLSTIATDKTRVADIALPASSSTEERWKLIPPPGFKLKRSVQQLRDMEIGPVTLQRKASAEADGSVTFVYQIELSRRQYTMAEVRRISEIWTKLSSEAAIRVEFAPEGSQLISDGKWKEGVELLRGEAEKTPPKVSALLRYASALLQVGLRDRAVEACRRAIEIDPKSDKAWARLSLVYRHDPAGRIYKKGMMPDEAENAILKAIALAPDEKRYVAEQAAIKVWKSGVEYEDKAELAGAIQLLQTVAKDLPSLGQQNVLPEALFHARRFQEVKDFYVRDEARESRGDLRLAAIAAVDGADAAIKFSETLAPDDFRRTNLRGAAQYLLIVKEYSKAADLFAAGASENNPVSPSDIELLRRTKPMGRASLSEKPVIAIVQRLVYSLLNPQAPTKFEDLVAPESKSLNDDKAGLTALLRAIGAYSRVAGLGLSWDSIADVVVSNVEFTAEGNDDTGYRVRFSDPSRNGASRTIAWVVRRDGELRILGLPEDRLTAGGEALSLAKKGNLDDARQWLRWQRDELRTPPAPTDPVGGDPYFRLLAAAEQSADSTLAAAAALVSQGPHYQDGVDVLNDLLSRAKDSTFTIPAEQVLAIAFVRIRRHEEALRIMTRMYGQFPASGMIFGVLGSTLVSAGKADEALEFTRNVNATSPLYATALRLRARVAKLQRKYKEAIGIYQNLSQAENIGASDWNDMAWATLFAPGALEPNLEWAQKAVQLSQGRSQFILQTLASLQAETGRLKEARESLLRYLGRSDSEAGTWYVMGRIAEQLGFNDSAIAMYKKIEKPERASGVDLYDLAAIRLAAAQGSPP